MAYKLGEIRDCRQCLKGYEHFGRNDRLCRICYTAYNAEKFKARRKDPVKLAHDQMKAKARYERNKAEVMSYLKTCRCQNCRESNPLCLNAFKPDGKVWKVSVFGRTRLTQFKLRMALNDCNILCLNCWAATRKTYGVGQMLKVSA